MLKNYLQSLQKTINQGDAREESFYKHLDALIKEFAKENNIKNIDITTLPAKTEVGNPDFRVWDGKNHITGYIEAKKSSEKNLDRIEESEQLTRYIHTFPNVILTNFYEYRLYRNGEHITSATIGRYDLAKKLQKTPPVEKANDFKKLLDTFFSFSLPKVHTAKTLAEELAKRTRFLRDEVISIEMTKKEKKGKKAILGFYEAFKKYLIGMLTEKSFADLYAQTITYGLFAARTRSDYSFNRELAFKYIPNTIGILRDVFRFISYDEPPKSLQIIVDDIAEVLKVTDVNKILHTYYQEGKGKDPIIHFYETFLSAYDPTIREKRGVYYTPEPVVSYIVSSINEIVKTHFAKADGLADKQLTLLDPAAGTLTFPAEAIKLAVEEYTKKYGEGGKTKFIQTQILNNYYAFELMMAPYAIGHLKMGFLFEELGYTLSSEERVKLYLTNTLDMEDLSQIQIPGLSSLSEESQLAGKVKKKQPILVILGNPPYSYASSNINEWTEKLLKTNLNGAQSYYEVDDKPLGEKNPKGLQDDYVKFLRFAQWKIHAAGYGIVGMITNHSYLDNPTFRGMRQSLMKTFNEIYILDLHGNSLKKETTPEGKKDENVFDIRQGTAIAIMIKLQNQKGCKVFHAEQFGLREKKYDWLEKNNFTDENYTSIKPTSPWYFYIPRDTEKIKHYLKWKKITDIFPVNSVGIVTGRDSFVVDFNKTQLLNRIRQLSNKTQTNDILQQAYNLKDKKNWKLSDARKEIEKIDDLNSFVKKITYRPFDERHIFYLDKLIERTRKNVMQHMLQENLGLVLQRGASSGKTMNYPLITKNIIDQGVLYPANRAISRLFPLYLYKDADAKKSLFDDTGFAYDEKNRKPNIDKSLFDTLSSTYGWALTPEDILYYIYGVFYSNKYRKKYAEFLKIDFPRVLFTKDYRLFTATSKLGKQLTELHLLKSNLLDTPITKYQGKGDSHKIEKVVYCEQEKRIYINKDKYFNNITPALWHYFIGGYQVLQKYLKDRKGKELEDIPHYARVVTAISKTIELQHKLDKIYSSLEKELILM